MSDIKKTPIKINKSGKMKSVRISARIAPNYKNGLDLIVRDRQSNLSEVLELAIIQLLNNYVIDNKKVMDFVGDSDQFITNLFFDIRAKAPTDEEIDNTLEQLHENLPPSDVPLSLVSPRERYEASIIASLVNSRSYTSFLAISIILAIETAWNEAFPENLVIEAIEMINTYAKEVVIPSIPNEKVKDNHETLLCVLADNEDLSINISNHYAVARDTYRELKNKYRYI